MLNHSRTKTGDVHATLYSLCRQKLRAKIMHEEMGEAAMRGLRDK